MAGFTTYKQFDKMDCGPTCLRMVAKHYGKDISLDRLRELSYITREGVSLMGISHAAESIGLKSLGTRVDLFTLLKKVPLPCIIPWEGRHFVVLYKTDKKNAYIADPAKGKVKISHQDLKMQWSGNGQESIALLLETTPKFYDQEEEEKASFSHFLKYFLPHKNLLIQVFFAIVFSSLVSLLTPFITQSVVDIGILGRNVNFIYLVLIAQLMLTIGSTVISFIQSWISLHLSIRISLSFVIGYVAKLMKMPFTFFELKTVGDVTKRISDNSRIESFLNQSLFSVIVSVFNFVIYTAILAYYNYKILLIFLLGNGLYIGWILLFLRKRREFDHEGFKIAADSENKLLQLFYGAREIILNNIEKEKRWEWERVQSKSYKLSKKVLLWNQFQSSGATVINSVVGVVISLIVALSVIEGDMTLGMMMSVQFIMGQIQAPLSSFLGLTHSYQDAKISLERLGEVINKKQDDNATSTSISKESDIILENVSFQYEGPHSPKVLNNINLKIPHNKTTAIVGASGSGKTTLLKLLLKLYQPTEGAILIGNLNLNYVSDYHWREQCGVVMQDNYIFADTIANNIVLKTYETIDMERLLNSVQAAYIKEWIESLPLQYQTKIGSEGVGLSQGQQQRVLIARALYKDPSFIFFDEATNALDSENETVILKNLIAATRNKTVVVIAHRLSTVKYADKIVVLKKGKIVEEGTHQALLQRKEHYYTLVNSQLS
ncbi:peptidase domain-containing ABC transporter [Maribacter arenosus]|uniref:Peptidase domain-containing ABC transporter n=1 Tax=Maribacter arenosus TaxID=1854708 RepID=A0ABR7VAX8_9FLAO|nr:peptidase domain-containing ABC transporter [Maribacter arenosus]MBD0849418.1 peptidase domain-containing ABC transporter [Maribacter arenosus]